MNQPSRILVRLSATVALCASLLLPAIARSEEPAAAADGSGQSPEVKVERDASGRKVIRITSGIVVEGRVQKPNAFYVLQRSSIDYDWEALKQDFLPRILEAAASSPF